jgi:uncharacterized protein YjbI with pentapeptide repeats
MFDHCIMETTPMRWLKRDLWKVGITIAGILLLLVLMVWISVSAADAREGAPELPTPVTGTVQATPTEDATVTALNKEKLAQEVQQLKNQNEPDLLGWLRTNATVLVVVIGGFIGLFRWFGDRRNQREKRDEDRFQAVVAGLGSDNIQAKVGAAIMLHTFLQPGYERFYRQAFNLAIAHLRLRKPDLETKDDPEAHILASLNQALIVVLEEAFPRAREWIKQGSPSSRLQRIKARLKRILPGEKSFDPQSLDARYIHLDRAFLWKADLEQVWMPLASLQNTDLTEAKLRGASLWRGNLTEANLYMAKLPRADLGQADLREANLREATLRGATLWGADLSGANLCFADLSKSDLHEATRFPVNIRRDKPEAELLLANLSKADLSNAKLGGANLLLADLSGADLSGADLSGADLSGADLHNATLCEATLYEARLMAVRLSGADFTKDDLSEAEVSQVKLTEINSAELNPNESVLRKADRNTRYWVDLRKWANHINVNPSEAELRKADLSGAEFLPVDLSGADLRGVKGLTKEQLEVCKARGAIIDEDSPASASQSPVLSPSPEPGNNIQAPLAPSAQGSNLTSDTGGSSAASSGPSSQS